MDDGQLIAPREADRFQAAARERLSELRRWLDQIVAKGGPRTPADTLEPLNDLFIRLGELHRSVSLMRNVHPDPAVRSAAEDCEQEVAQFATELGLNRALYEAVRSASADGLDAVGRRMLEHLLRDFHRAGVDRDEPKRDEVRRIRSELVSLSQEFARNISSDVRAIELESQDELEGLPDDYIRRHPPDGEGRVRITTDYPDYNPFMVYARSGRSRERLYRAFRSRAYPANVEVLKSILKRRHRLSALLGYRSWADYATEDKMIRRAQAVGEFIERVTEAAERRSSHEYEVLLERKRRDEPGASEVHDWEKGYFEELVRAELYDVDSRELRPYFQYEAVKRGVLETISGLFGIEFRAAPRAPRWHEDVEVLDVFEDGSRAGRIYLDMHPREGKFKHAAMFPLVQGVRGRRLPEGVLVCNFSDPRGTEGPALLEHDDVVTFFHEVGHLLHHLFARDHDWVEFSGTGTEWDFVEVPSQLMEEWAWDPVVLERFAHHWETGEVIPADLVERLRKAKDFGQGLQVRQQMYYASLSLRCHEADPERVDVESLQRELQNRYSRFRFVDDTHFLASFGHLDSYSALYYTYMWSLVIEKDLSQLFKARGLMDRDTAARYRDAILAPGGTRDAADLVREFLGRGYGFDAFERWLDAGDPVTA